jgi:hypothetical protein
MSALTPPGARPPRFTTPWSVVSALLAALAVASAPFFGFYDASVWGPIALVVLPLALAMRIAGGVPRGPAGVALAGLLALWVWSSLSREWGQSSAQGLTEANRWALYAAFFAVVALVAQRDRHVGTGMIGAIAVGIGALSAWLLIRIASNGGASLFIGTRLQDPVGYANGEASFLLLGFWPCVAIAERNRWLAGPAVATASAIACLVFMTQSRGAALALGGTTILVLAAVPGRVPRTWILIVVGAAFVAAAGPLADLARSVPVAGSVEVEGARHAARTALASSLLAGVLWAAINAAALRTGAEPRMRAMGQRISHAGLALVGLAAIVVAIGTAGRSSDWVGDQYDAFVHLQSDSTGQIHLASGGGNRYDYWRIAWRGFKDRPFKGFGAGNYDARYYAERRTSEDIKQPHSLELQTLMELGVVGGLALLVFLGAVAKGFLAVARRGTHDPAARMLAVGAGGTFGVWLLHTSVDWMHLIVGLTGVALCCAAALTTAAGELGGLGWPARLRAQRSLPAVLAAVAVVFAMWNIGRATLARHERSLGVAQLERNPVESLRHSSRALSLQDDDVATYYLRAAALARLNDYVGARREMRAAIRLEPNDWVSWAALGDLALRRGLFTDASRAYSRAARLNPQDTTLAADARDPHAAAQRMLAP